MGGSRRPGGDSGGTAAASQQPLPLHSAPLATAGGPPRGSPPGLRKAAAGPPSTNLVFLSPISLACKASGWTPAPGADQQRRAGAGLAAVDLASWGPDLMPQGPDLQVRDLPRPFVLVVDGGCCGAVREVRPRWRAAPAC